jgi:uncharacterized protein
MRSAGLRRILFYLHFIGTLFRARLLPIGGAVGRIADDGMRPAAERIHLIDSLRAIALAGVILFNIAAMVGGFLIDRLLAEGGPLDLGFAGVVIFLVQGKARACFALLFGVGFGILMERSAARGHDFTPFYLRRMTVLLAIGLFNLTFLFFGDILVLYALLGMAMLLFRRLGDSALLRLGLILILVPALLIGGFEIVSGAPVGNLSGLDPASVARLLPASLPSYTGHSYASYVAANWNYYVSQYLDATPEVLIYDLGVLGSFLLGLWTARNALLADVERWRPFLRRVAWWCLPAGLILSLAHGSERLGVVPSGALHGVVIASYGGETIMALGYIALASLLLTGSARSLQPALAPMGRMTLTGYLGANAIGAFTFYGWGLGSMLGWSITGLCLFALLIFASLCLFSAAWMRAFRFGPAEWVWRSLTYGRAQPLRR